MSRGEIYGKKEAKRLQLNSISSLEIIHIQSTSLNVEIELYPKPVSLKRKWKREVRFRVKLRNMGENALANLSIDFLSPKGISIVDPGMDIGTSRRHLRLPRLSPGDSVTYKLGILHGDEFESGVLAVVFSDSLFRTDAAPVEIKVAVTTS
jgi:hypothetical protein